MRLDPYIISEIFTEDYQITNIWNKRYSPDLYISGRYTTDNKPFNIQVQYFNYYYYTEEDLGWHMPFYPKSNLKKSYKFRNKSNYEYIYESDMSNDMRFIHDLYLEYPSSDLVSPRVWFFDIETLSLNKWENPDNITNAFTLYDTYDEKYVTFVVLDKKHKKDIGKLELGNKIIFFLQSEEQLYQFIGQLIQKTKVNYISGWNILDFDIWYMANRIIKFYPDLNGCWSPFGLPFDKEERKDMRHETYWIPGIGLCDYQLMYKQFEQNKKSSYALDFIAKEELGKDKGKLEYEGSLNDLYINDLEKFIDYNIQDVELLVDIDKAKDYISLANSLKEISSHQTQNFNFRYTIKLSYGIISRFVNQLPNPLAIKGKIYGLDQSGNSYSGANVRIPITGFHDWLTDLDASIPGDHIISVLKPNGSIIEYTLEDYFYEYSLNDKVLTVLNDNNIIKEYFDDITGVFKHYWEEDIIEIEDEDGNILRLTDNDSLYVYDLDYNIIKLINARELLNDFDRYLLIETDF